MAALLSSLTPGLAQKDNHPYLRLDAGVNILPSTEIQPLNSSLPMSVDTEFKLGYRLDLTAGMLLRDGGVISYKGSAFNLDVVPELNFGLTYNSAKKVENTDIAELGGSIDLYQFPFMANLLLRGTLLTERLHLSLGGGAGAVMSLLDVSSRTGGGSETDFVFAWQAIARLDYDINDHLSAGLSYRFMGTASAKYGGDLQVKNDGTLNNNVLLSLNWVF